MVHVKAFGVSSRDLDQQIQAWLNSLPQPVDCFMHCVENRLLVIARESEFLSDAVSEITEPAPPAEPPSPEVPPAQGGGKR
jgi:hypothetical protein